MISHLSTLIFVCYNPQISFLSFLLKRCITNRSKWYSSESNTIIFLPWNTQL
jgi:hypothetical protein